MRVACVQTAPAVGSFAANLQATVDGIARAAAHGADLVVLPELATSGYVFRSRDEAAAAAEEDAGSTLAVWSALAREHDIVVVGGFCELGPERQVFNAAAVVDATGVLAVYHKNHLWADEREVFDPGEEPAPVVETEGGRIGLAICADVAYPEVARTLALAGAEILALPVNCPYVAWPTAPNAHGVLPTGGHPDDVLYYRAAAQANRIYVATCDREGDERGSRWLGWSVIVDVEGRVIAGPPREGGGGLVLADCDLALARDKSWGPKNDLFADRRPELYRPRIIDRGLRART